MQWGAQYLSTLRAGFRAVHHQLTLGSHFVVAVSHLKGESFIYLVHMLIHGKHWAPPARHPVE